MKVVETMNSRDKKSRGKIEEIKYDVAVQFLLPKHYAGRIPSISKAFGWYFNNELMAVCTFGKPASPSLCRGICGESCSANVYELNRLCRVDEFTEPLSCFVSACLRRLRIENWIIVSYSDTGMNHHGYIYQACNFIYTGQTKERTDKWTPSGKHSRHYLNSEQSGFRKVRTSKHRYVYFCTFDKKLKRRWMDSLKYSVLDYPKGDNKNYVLGEYIKDKIVISK